MSEARSSALSRGSRMAGATLSRRPSASTRSGTALISVASSGQLQGLMSPTAAPGSSRGGRITGRRGAPLRSRAAARMLRGTATVATPATVVPRNARRLGIPAPTDPRWRARIDRFLKQGICQRQGAPDVRWPRLVGAEWLGRLALGAAALAAGGLVAEAALRLARYSPARSQAPGEPYSAPRGRVPDCLPPHLPG